MSFQPYEPDPTQVIHTLCEPETFRSVYQLCKTALLVDHGRDKNREMRGKVYDVARSFRMQSLKRFGHETNFEEFDIQAISALHRSGCLPVSCIRQIGGNESRAVNLIDQI
jgi:hypothetical protein